jgi:hypothetical protein
LLHCFAGCAPADILRALEAQRLIEPAAAASVGEYKADAGSAMNEAALRIWSESHSIRGTPVQAYLAGRDVATDSPQLRYNPRTPHGRQPDTRYRPALIAAVRNEDGIVAIHRTFLGSGASGGLAGRRGLGRFGRGSVRLGDAGPRLGLAEGIETALSATALFGVPCWATLGSERFALVELPAEVEELLLFLDHDGGGRRAEALAREHFAHVCRIETHVPERPGDDWNDVLRAARAAREKRGRAGADPGRRSGLFRAGDPANGQHSDLHRRRSAATGGCRCTQAARAVPGRKERRPDPVAGLFPIDCRLFGRFRRLVDAAGL